MVGPNAGPAAPPPTGQGSKSRPNGPGDWLANTQSHLRKVDEMRKEVRKQFQRDALAAGEADKAPNIGGPAMEDRLKRRHRTTQSLAVQVASKMEAVQHVIFQVKSAITELSRTTTSTRASLSVVEMRMDLRGRRPNSEQVDDLFNDALQQEHGILREIIAEIAGRLEAAQELISPLEEAKAEMNNSRLTLHLDRSGYTQQLLDRVFVLEKEAFLFSRYSSALLAEADKKCKKALAKTVAAMKEKIMATRELKEQIEKDMVETRRTITDAELHLDRLERQLQIQLAMPERQQPGGGDLCNKKLAASTGVLADLRQKIKAAAYTGGAGRQLGVLFGRFDRDGSGMLDEDEVRRAFRRACRIPPKAVSDAEIASLCELLDEDRSGSISIAEITDFLCADVNVESLEEQCSWARTALANLKAAQSQSQADMRGKVSAWKIDVACSRVTTIKGLKLDGLPSPGRPTTTSLSARTPACTALPLTRPTTTAPASASQDGSRPMTAAKDLGSAVSPRDMPPGSASSPRAWGWSSQKGSPRKPQATAPKTLPALTLKPEEPKIGFDATIIETVRSKIKIAADSQKQGRQLDAIFARVDKDSTGRLSQDEFLQTLRRYLKISTSVVSDEDISAVFAALDTDCSGYILIPELVAFVDQEPNSPIANRSAKPHAGTSKTFAQDNQMAHIQGSQAGPPDESAGPSAR